MDRPERSHKVEASPAAVKQLIMEKKRAS